MKRRTKFVTVLALLLAMTAAGGLIFSYSVRQNGPIIGSGEITNSGKADIGGPFTLTGPDGKRISDTDFRGKYMLVYFGYTFCPDICPASLQAMSEALDLLGAQADKVQPIFITVDPSRDTPEQMADYVNGFDPRFIGLSGSPRDTAKAAKAYRVYYARVESADPSDEYYLIDHSAYIYLMGPDGAFIRVFSYGTSPQDMAKDIAKVLKQ